MNLMQYPLVYPFMKGSSEFHYHLPASSWVGGSPYEQIALEGLVPTTGSGTLKRLLTQRFAIQITPSHLQQLVHHCTTYELRDKHPEAFNTPMLGLSKCYFLDRDRAALFGIFGVDHLEFKRTVLQSPNVRKEFLVSSDEYNVFTIWLMHQFWISTRLNQTQKREGMYTLMKLLHYKFFTSLVNHSFRYGANPDIMAATIDSLSAKFDIKQADTSTWRLIMEARSKDVIDTGSIHWVTLTKFAPDEAVLYVITDVQTRIRTKLNLITSQYYLMRDKEIRIGSTSIIDEVDGQKIIRDLDGSYDTMVTNLCNTAMNTSKFIRHDYVKFIVAASINIREDMLRDLLTQFSHMASLQYEKGHADKIKTIKVHDKDEQILIGYKVLIQNIIQKTYRTAIIDHDTDMKSKLSILEKARNIYRSSRIIDPDILQIKDSVELFVTTATKYEREATIASLRIALILYLILMSFESM